MHEHGDPQGDVHCANCAPKHAPHDYLFWGSLVLIVGVYILSFLEPSFITSMTAAHHFVETIVVTVNTIWWGVLLGILAVAVMSLIPREFIVAILGKPNTVGGIVRATLGGILLDLCSHGILFVGTKLYERGASIGQVMAFLIASPWNSLSLTFILLMLVGWKFTLLLIVLSMMIGIMTGLIVDRLVHIGKLPSNPHAVTIPLDFHVMTEAKKLLRTAQPSWRATGRILATTMMESRMILRWIFLGVILSALVRAIIPEPTFATLFGPTILGLLLTLVLATVIEVCSEGSTPLAADIVTRAGAHGNGFAFLMAGVATDYTEIMALREVTKSWKLALALPLVTVPQVMLVAYVLNQFG